MANIVFSHTFSSGATLTAAQLETMKSEITAQVNNKNIDAANIEAGSVTTAELAAPNADFSVLVKPVNSPDALTACVTSPMTTSEFATAVPGVDSNQNTLSTLFQIPVNATAIGISIYCRATASAGGTRANTAQLFVAASGIGSPLTFTAGGIVSSTGMSQAMTTSQALEIRMATDSGTNDGVTDPHIWVHCKALHQA